MASTQKLPKSLPLIEYHISEALKGNGFEDLETYLNENNTIEGVPSYNKQMLTDLDTLIQKEMDQRNFTNVALLLRCTTHYKSFDSTSHQRLINDGVIFKMAKWLNRAIELYTKEESSNAAVVMLFEHFFDAILMIADFNKAGRALVIGTLFFVLCGLVINPMVDFYVQLDAIKTINTLLNHANQFMKRQLLEKEDTQTLMKVWGQHLAFAGDYELQVGLTEVLCRLIKVKERVELSKCWFPMEYIVTAFNAIKDCNFETDCRTFLNTVNGILGTKRSVNTFPCIAIFLEDCELRMPPDDTLENFWVDFNNGSHRISFFIADDGEESDKGLWEAISLPNDMILEYSLEETSPKEQVVTLTLLTPLSSAKKDGYKVTIHFDKSFDMLSALGDVYGKEKLKVCGNLSSDVAPPLSIPRKQLSNKASQDRGQRCQSEQETDDSSRKNSLMEKRAHSEGDHSPRDSMKQAPTSSKSSEPMTVFKKQTNTSKKISDSIINVTAVIKHTNNRAEQDCNDARVNAITTPERSNVTATGEVLTETRQNSTTGIPKNNIKRTKETNIECGAATKNKLKAVELPATEIRQNNTLFLSPVLEESTNQASNAKKDLSTSVLKADGMTANKSTKPKPSTTSDHRDTFTEEDKQSDQDRNVTRSSSTAGGRPEDDNSTTDVDIERLLQYQLDKSVSHLQKHYSDTLTEESDSSSEQRCMKTKNAQSQKIQKVTQAHVTKNIKDHKCVAVSDPVPTLPQPKWRVPGIADHSTSSDVANKMSPSYAPMKAPNTKSVIKAIAGKYNHLSKKISFKATEQIYEFEEGFESGEVLSKKPTKDSKGKHVGKTVSEKTAQRSSVYDFNSEEEDEHEITVAGYNRRKSTLGIADRMNSISAKQSEKNVKPRSKRLFSETESDALTDAKSDVSWVVKSFEKKKPKLKGYSSNKTNMEENFLARTLSFSTTNKQGTRKKAASVTAARKPLKNMKNMPKKRGGGGGGDTDGKPAPSKRVMQGKRRLKSQMRSALDSISSDDQSGSKRKGGMPMEKFPTERDPPQPKRPRRAAAAKYYRDMSDDEIKNNKKIETEENESASHKVISRGIFLYKNTSNKSEEDEDDLACTVSLKPPTSIEKLRNESYSSDGNVEIYKLPLTVSPIASTADKSFSPMSLSAGQVESPGLSLVASEKSLSNESHDSSNAQELPKVVLGTIRHRMDTFDEALMLQTETSPEPSPVSQQTFIPRLYQPSKFINLNTPKDNYSYAPEPLLNTPPSTSVAKRSLRNKETRRAELNRLRKCSIKPERATVNKMNETMKLTRCSLKPKRLLHSPAVNVVCNTKENVSSNDASGDELSVDTEINDVVNDDSMVLSLEHFSAKVVKITKAKYDKIEEYTKKSLQVTENEMSKLWGQVRHRRIQKIKSMKKLLLDELHTVNEENRLLEETESEMLNFLKKQKKTFTAFRMKQEERLKRIQSLFVESRYNAEKEERMVTENGTQTLQEELKIYQEHLLNETQRQELNQVRHALETAFCSAYN